MPGNQSTPRASNSFFQPHPDNLSFFHGIPKELLQEIFALLPCSESRALSLAFSTTKDEELCFARTIAKENLSKLLIEHEFLKAVADAEVQKAEDILKYVKLDKPMLRQLLTRDGEYMQKCDLLVKGNALEIAIKCWDWSCSGQEEMAEMLMRYMRMLEEAPPTANVKRLPSGEELIKATMQKLFPKGIAAHQKAQELRAEKFTQTILEPLAETIEKASAHDFRLVYAITEKEDNEVDDYIANTLANNRLWHALLSHHEAVKIFMKKDVTFNPNYFQKAFELIDRKYNTENDLHHLDLREGWDRLGLLSIHAVGGIQACSPTIVGMLFARNIIRGFYNINEARRATLKVVRDCEFMYGVGDAFGRSRLNLLLVGKKYWAATYQNTLVPEWSDDSYFRCFEFFYQAKTRSLESSLGLYLSELSVDQQPPSQCVIQ